MIAGEMDHRIQRVFLVSAACGVTFALGCASRPGPVLQSSFQWTSESEMDRDQLWNAAEHTLRDRGYRLDRLDPRAGLMTTMPEYSQQLFEFWRRDVATVGDAWEATVNPIRRWVSVQIVEATDEDAVSRLTVAVHKQRLSSLDRQFNNSGSAYQFFGNSLPSTTGLVRVTPEMDRWLDIGRDAAMEDRLLRLILARAGQP